MRIREPGAVGPCWEGQRVVADWRFATSCNDERSETGAVAKQPMKDVIVLLPGILGSVLERDGDEVWAPSPGAIGRALWRLGRNLNDLALGDDPWESDDLGDGVRATRLMPDVHIIPGFWGIDGYSGISSMIRSTFDVTAGVNFFEFPYDWRRDNRVAARALKKLADESLHARRKDVPDAKLVLVGHSMGGLVSRYYLECLDGWRDTRALITFGTPYRGSINAVDFLANGFVKKAGPLKLIDLSKLLHSLTSVYQLLPVYPCIDLGDGYVRPAETANRIEGLDESRAKAALQFHHDIRDATAAHDRSAYAIHSIVGITQGTKQSARLDGGRIVLDEKGFDGEDRKGDGTVPRVSATPIETDDWGGYQPMYSSDKHGSLQNDDAVRTQLLGILTARFHVGVPGRRAVRPVEGHPGRPPRAAQRRGAARSPGRARAVGVDARGRRGRSGDRAQRLRHAHPAPPRRRRVPHRRGPAAPERGLSGPRRRRRRLGDARRPGAQPALRLRRRRARVTLPPSGR